MRLNFLKGDIIRGGSIILLANLMASMVAFLANLTISGKLGPENFGIFKVIIYLFAFLPAIADFGINSTLTKYISEFGKDDARTKYIVKWFLKVKVLIYILLVSVVFLLRDYIAIYFLKEVSLSYVVLAGIVLLSFNFFLTFYFITLGFQSFKIFSLSQFLNAAISAVLAILFSPLGIFYMIIGWSLGSLLGSIPTMLLVFKKGLGTTERVDAQKIFYGFSLPVYPVDLSNNLFTMIIPLLSLFFSREMVGYYSFAFMFYYVALLIPNSMSMVLFPKVSELNGLKRYDHAKRILRKSLLYYSLIALIGLVSVYFLSEWVINTVAREYLPSLFLFKVITSLGFLLSSFIHV
jgi:O-antigen/teichoic acid export membrane protein